MRTAEYPPSGHLDQEPVGERVVHIPLSATEERVIYMDRRPRDRTTALEESQAYHDQQPSFAQAAYFEQEQGSTYPSFSFQDTDAGRSFSLFRGDHSSNTNLPDACVLQKW